MEEKNELKEKVVAINRVAKVVKGVELSDLVQLLSLVMKTDILV